MSLGFEIYVFKSNDIDSIACSLEEKSWPTLTAYSNKGLSSQSYGFSSSHVWIWELNYKESWAPKNWCFWTVMLQKTLESPLNCKEIQPVYPKGNQSWIFIGRTDAEAETPYFGHLMWRIDSFVKTLMLGQDWRRPEDEMVGWHHQLSGHESE